MPIKLFKILLLTLFSFTFFFLFAQKASAVAPWLIYLGISAGLPLLLGTLKTIFSITAFIAIAGGVHFIAGKLITSGVNFQTTLLDPEKITVIQTAWTMLRDFVNIFFILVLLIIAFATIFNKPTGYTAKDLLPKLIIAALLINFSLVIADWVIDLLWVPAAVFLKPLGPELGGQIANALNIQKFFDPGFIAGTFTLGTSEIIELIFRGVLFVVEAFIFLWIALIIWARIPVLIGLMIISPIAWLGYTLPVIRKQSWDAWWSKLFCWGAIPIPLFGLIYFVVLFNQRLNAEITRAVPASVLNTVLSFIGFNTSQAIVWIITAGLFLGGLMYIKGLSCSLYGWMTLGLGKTWGGIRRGTGAAVDWGYGAVRAAGRGPTIGGLAGGGSGPGGFGGGPPPGGRTRPGPTGRGTGPIGGPPPGPGGNAGPRPAGGGPSASGAGGNRRTPNMSPTQTQAYATLGAPPTASWNEIREARNRTLRANHPDLFMNEGPVRVAEANKKTQEIITAYDILRRTFRAAA